MTTRNTEDATMTSYATEIQVATIRAQAYNATAREMASTGITLSHEQADELGDEGMGWLRERLGLHIVTDDAAVRGIPSTPYSAGCDDDAEVR